MIAGSCSGPGNLYSCVKFFLTRLEDTFAGRNCVLCQRSVQWQGKKMYGECKGEFLKGLAKEKCNQNYVAIN